MGRTGSLYAFELAGILPDVIVLSKAIGGGLPLAVIIYREGLDVWKPGAHAGTFRGNQLAMSAGLATLRFIDHRTFANTPSGWEGSSKPASASWQCNGPLSATCGAAAS